MVVVKFLRFLVRSVASGQKLFDEAWRRVSKGFLIPETIGHTNLRRHRVPLSRMGGNTKRRVTPQRSSERTAINGQLRSRRRVGYSARERRDASGYKCVRGCCWGAPLRAGIGADAQPGGWTRQRD